MLRISKKSQNPASIVTQFPLPPWRIGSQIYYSFYLKRHLFSEKAGPATYYLDRIPCCFTSCLHILPGGHLWYFSPKFCDIWTSNCSFMTQSWPLLKQFHQLWHHYNVKYVLAAQGWGQCEKLQSQLHKQDVRYQPSPVFCSSIWCYEESAGTAVHHALPSSVSLSGCLSSSNSSSTEVTPAQELGLHPSSPYLLPFICHRTHWQSVKGAIWEQKRCPPTVQIDLV